MAAITKNTLGKKEKLKSRKQIDQLFAARTFVTETPIRLFYQAQPAVKHPSDQSTTMSSPIKAGFGCSKKFFKHANKRNRVKRLFREAYRKQKATLKNFCDQHQLELRLFWLYGHKELPTLLEVEEKMAKLMAVLVKKLEKAQQQRPSSGI